MFLVSVLIAIAIAGCDQKNLVSNIDGNWHLQKYTEDGADLTHTYDSTHMDFKWSFNADMTFYQYWKEKHVATIVSFDTTQHIDTVTHLAVIDRVDTSTLVEPYVYDSYHTGKWLLTNGNKFLQTRDSANGTQLFQITDHSASSLHLLKGNTEILFWRSRIYLCYTTQTLSGILCFL